MKELWARFREWWPLRWKWNVKTESVYLAKTIHELEVARGSIEALRIHTWHVGGRESAHNQTLVLYECADCSARVFLPEGTF